MAAEADRVRTVVVVTASNDKQAAAVEQELAARQQSGVFSGYASAADTLMFAVPDPSNARVGSGGATFNALITVQELLSAKPGWSLDTCRVFMIHSGGDSQRLPCQSVCGKAWSALPTYNASHELDAPIDLLLHHAFKLFRDVRAGLVIASSDVLLHIPPSFVPIWPTVGATGLAIPTDKSYGPNHGVYHVGAPVSQGGAEVLDHCREVSRFFQKASVPELTAAGAVRPDGTVLLDTGIIYFSPSATTRLVELARTYPLDCCSYLGVDMNRAPLRIELYSDIMMAMGNGLGLSKDEYHRTATSDTQADRIAVARDIMWAQLAEMPLYALVVEGGDFTHVGTTLEYLQLLSAPTPAQAGYHLHRRAAWFEDGRSVSSTGSCDASDDPTATGFPSCTILNSLLHTRGGRGPRSVIEHSELHGDWYIGTGSLASGVRSVQNLRVRDGVAVQELRLADGRHRVVSVLGVDDPIKDPYTKASARICGVRWDDLMTRAGITPADIWPDTSSAAKMTIWTAQLFPVFPVDGSYPSTTSEAVLHDRASLWLQWIAATAGSNTGSAAIVSPRSADDISEEVIATWRAARRLSLKDILALADASIEFQWRRALRGKVDVRLLVGAVSQGGNVCVNDLVLRLGRSALPLSSVAAGVGTAIDSVAAPQMHAPATSFAVQALTGLDQVARTARADIAGRALAVQSALLWAMAGWGGTEHRTGPAHHHEWLPAFELLEGDYAATETTATRSAALHKRMRAIDLMAALRGEWMQRPHMLGRAARHYERASQLLTAQCIYTAPVQRPTPFSVGAGRWVYARAPARIDLAGGWSDTPPITYEATVDGSIVAPLSVADLGLAEDDVLAGLAGFANRGGGLVVNVAIDVDGERPMGTRARRTLIPSGPAMITIRTRSKLQKGCAAAASSSSDEGAAEASLGDVISSVTVTSLDDMRDYNQPHAEGALVKCVLLCLGVVHIPRASAAAATAAEHHDLASQLSQAIGGSLEVETWSNLPQGSGLGTSSILAATVIAATSQAIGMKYDLDSMNHLVLKVEQMLSTGGGWQDQVGGLWPGVKASSCVAALPVSVAVTPLAGSGDSVAQALNRHLFLIYTGKTRLAKNLLQRVLRQWAVRENDVTHLVAELRRNAVTMAAAVKRGDMKAIGSALSKYWEQKKLMAPMAEPAEAAAILHALQDHVFGASLCGAGGGGFLVGVSKAPDAAGEIERILRSQPATADLVWSIHACAVNTRGIEVTLES